jgi:hypothetical protein
MSCDEVRNSLFHNFVFHNYAFTDFLRRSRRAMNHTWSDRRLARAAGRGCPTIQPRCRGSGRDFSHLPWLPAGFPGSKKMNIKAMYILALSGAPLNSFHARTPHSAATIGADRPNAYESSLLGGAPL